MLHLWRSIFGSSDTPPYPAIPSSTKISSAGRNPLPGVDASLPIIRIILRVQVLRKTPTIHSIQATTWDCLRSRADLKISHPSGVDHQIRARTGGGDKMDWRLVNRGCWDFGTKGSTRNREPASTFKLSPGAWQVQLLSYTGDGFRFGTVHRKSDDAGTSHNGLNGYIYSLPLL